MREIYLADGVVALAEYIKDEDDPALYACWSDPNTERGYNTRQTRTYAEYYAREQKGWGAIIVRCSDEMPVGCVMLFPEIAQPDLAIMIYPEYRGLGYGTRAFTLGAQYCAGAFGLKRIYAGCYEDNLVSRKMLERCGFVLDPEPVGGPEKHFLTGESIVQLEFVKYF